ncbi:unnamed protein product [Lota lota]
MACKVTDEDDGDNENWEYYRFCYLCALCRQGGAPEIHRVLPIWTAVRTQAGLRETSIRPKEAWEKQQSPHGSVTGPMANMHLHGEKEFVLAHWCDCRFLGLVCERATELNEPEGRTRCQGSQTTPPGSATTSGGGTPCMETTWRYADALSRRDKCLWGGRPHATAWSWGGVVFPPDKPREGAREGGSVPLEVAASWGSL